MHKNFTLKTVFFFLLTFSSFLLYSEQYQITHENYSINGITKEYHIAHKIKIDHKRIFDSREELDDYVENIIQKYVNLRFFDDIKINCMFSATQENLPTQVFLEIKIVDSKHIVLLPYYKYDSKYGNVFTIAYRDSNFMGSLELLKTELFVEVKNKKNADGLNITPGILFNYDVPFYLGNIEASFVNDYILKYTIGMDKPEWDGTTGFKFNLPFNDFKLQLKVLQQAVHNLDYLIYNDELYFSETADIGVPILICSSKKLGDITYTPSINYIYNWKPNHTEINKRNDDLLSPELLFSNCLTIDNVNWNTNLRNGIFFEVKENAGYNFLLNTAVVGSEMEFKGYFSNEYAGFNLRLYGFVYKNKNKRIDSHIRGIKDDQYFNITTPLFDTNSTSTPSALIINMDIPIRLFTLDFDKMKMHVLKPFDFEVQISPFIDIALNSNRVTGRTFDLRDGFYTAGIECIVYPLKWKSLSVRGSVGFDLGRTLLKDFIDTSWRPETSVYEFSVGIGLYY